MLAVLKVNDVKVDSKVKIFFRTKMKSEQNPNNTCLKIDEENQKKLDLLLSFFVTIQL